MGDDSVGGSTWGALKKSNFVLLFIFLFFIFYFLLWGYKQGFGEFFIKKKKKKKQKQNLGELLNDKVIFPKFKAWQLSPLCVFVSQRKIRIYIHTH